MTSAQRKQLLLAAAIGVKVATLGLLALALTRPDLPQFEGKAFVGRAVMYPVALLVLPAGWGVAARRRVPYPAAADLLIGLPFLIDMLGNALNMYDTIDWWDDGNHLVNWILHTAGIGLLLSRTSLTPLPRAGLGVAWASTTAILWELAEYVAFVPNSPEAATAYGDTLGDLALGLIGGTIASVVVAARSGNRRALADGRGSGTPGSSIESDGPTERGGAGRGA